MTIYKIVGNLGIDDEVKSEEELQELKDWIEECLDGGAWYFKVETIVPVEEDEEDG